MFMKRLPFFFILSTMTGLLVWGTAIPFVTSDGDKTFIVDQRGERWDVTQAKSIGFKPEGFQYGIGRDAFTPLDETDLADDTSSVSKNLRIIGISDKIGSKPVAVGY
jgi:hypothetical protein